MTDGVEHALEYVVSGVLFCMAMAMLLWMHGAFMKQAEMLALEMDEFMDNHSDICEKIDDMKSIIIKYLPESCSIHQRCGLLYDIYTMREDLSHHTRLEMELLARLALEAERRVKL